MDQFAGLFQMTILNRILLVAIVGELAVAGIFFFNRSTTVQPPLPDLSLMDSATAADLRKLREDLDTEESDSWLNLAKAYAAFGYYAEAEACSRRAVELAPDSPETNTHWGLTLDRLGRLGEATERLRGATSLTSGPRVSETWYRIGRIELRRERPNEAEAAFRRAGAFAPAMFQLAKLFVRTSRADQALPIVEWMLGNAPNDLQTLLLRAQVARALRDSQAVQEFNERAERGDELLDLDRTFDLLTRTRSQYGVWRMYKDANDLEQSHNSMNPSVLQRESELLREANRLHWLEITVPPLARIEIQLGRTDAAIKLLEKQFERAGEAPETLERLGDAVFSKGEHQKAQQIWERAAAMRSGGERRRLHQKLGVLYERQGDQVAARNQRAHVHHTSGLAAFRSNEVEQAGSDFARAVELNPELAHSWFYLGKVQSVLGQTRDARNAYERCLKLDPEHGRAHAGLAQLSQMK